MRTLRLFIACAILRGAGIIAEVVAGPEPGISRNPSSLRPAERMLLGSIVGMFIAGLWLWICARAGR